MGKCRGKISALLGILLRIKHSAKKILRGISTAKLDVAADGNRLYWFQKIQKEVLYFCCGAAINSLF